MRLIPPNNHRLVSIFLTLLLPGAVDPPFPRIDEVAGGACVWKDGRIKNRDRALHQP